MSQLFNLLGRVVNVVSAHFAEKYLPLAEESLRLRMGRGRYGGVKRANAALRQRCLGPEVTREIRGREGLSLGSQIEQRPQKSFSRVFVDLDRFLHLPLIVAIANEDEVIAVETDPKHGVEAVPVLGAEIVEALFDLIDDFPGAGRVGPRPDACTGTARVLVLDDHPIIDGVDAASGDGELVLPLKLDAGFLLDECELLLGFDPDLFFLVGHGRGGSDLVREFAGLSRD